MLNHKIEILSFWIIIKILLCDKIKTFDINHINQTQKNKTPNENISIKNQINNNKIRVLQTADYEPIRIYIDTYNLNSTLNILNIGQTEIDLINRALNKAKSTLEKLIKVQRISNVISAQDYKNLVKSNNNEDILTGILQEIDLIIFIEYKGLTNQRCNELPQILQRKDEVGRPIVGSIAFDPNFYSIEDSEEGKYKLEFYSSLFLHQFTHILGFNKTILGNKVQTKQINRLSGFDKQIVQGQKLMEFAKKYFNCTKADFIGIELEEKKAKATCDDDLIHWDSRILLGDYMNAFPYVQEQVISEFTLALLEDTGFYKVNYYTGGLMRFGKNAGCEFFTQDCNEPLENVDSSKKTQRKSTFKNEFCSSQSKTTCTSGRQSRGICENKKIRDDLIDDQNYLRGSSETDPKSWKDYGNKYAEYCPISLSEKENEEEPIYSYIGSCNLGKTENYGRFAFYYGPNKTIGNTYSIFTDSFGESFSDNSFCAFSSIIKKDDPKKELYQDFIRPTCYEMFCSNRSLTIKIKEQYIVCPREGGYVSIGKNYMGNLACPDYNLICSQTVPCNNMFDCVDKKSTKKEDYIYDYKPVDVSVQIILIPESEKIGKGYEESENGLCPQYCSECNELKQCFECKNTTPYYIGVRENDNNPINCSSVAPKDSYYNKNDSENKIHYYKCIDHCKVCKSENPNKCYQCYPEYRLNDYGECIERIDGCGLYDNSSVSAYFDNKTNNNGTGYKFCLKCNESKGYYCFGSNKGECKPMLDDNNTYFDNDFECKQKCDLNFTNCYSCNKTHCNKCKSGYYLNYENKCLKKVDFCQNDTIRSNYSQCDKCEGNYRCLNKTKTKCNYISNLELYFYIDDSDDNDCMELCTTKYDSKCKNCTNQICSYCIDSYFVYNNVECIKSLDNCIEHYYDRVVKNCTKCKENYYCINNNKSICSYISPEENETYYTVDRNPNPCRERCYKKYTYCYKCDDTHCKECVENAEFNDQGSCYIDPHTIHRGNCLIKFHEINDDINIITLDDFPVKFAPNLKNADTIDHYVNKDYTITVFLHSECTEDLLKQGYFKIDSRGLQQSIIDKFDSNENLTYSVFVTHNFKSHFRYYNHELHYLDTTESTNLPKTVEYIITNKYTRSINETLGPIVANLVESEKINIFERDSDVYNSYCQNITFLGIDMPLKQRLLFLYPHKFSERLACLGEDCVIDEFNFDESTCTCNCKIGNKFQDILKEDKFTHYDGPLDEFNNFIDSISIIKCTGNGFNSKNMKANPGFFLVIIGIVAQIILYVLYSIIGEPITNLSKIASNPPKKAIMLFSDWDKRIKKNESEGEIFIQPRDDADEQLLEEERTYSNDGNDASNISLDTNVGGENLGNRGKNKLNEKPDKRVLILLKNKGIKKSKAAKDYEDLKSDSEIMKLNDESKIAQINFCKIYCSVVSLKQHIINYFSFISCCKITKSYIPLTIRVIRSIFILFLSFVFNILFLNQSYYEKKFNHFNDKYTFIHSENSELAVSTGERISFALSNTFAYALVSFILLLIVNLIIGFLFFSVRKKIIENIRNNDISNINELVTKTKANNLIFFIINLALMVVFLLAITGFVGAYGGGFVDYFVSGIISLIFFEIFPFLWSIFIALFIYIGSKKKIKCLSSFGNFFMF